MLVSARLGRGIAAATLIVSALVAPSAAAAQSLDRTVLFSSYNTSDSYSVDRATGALSFGDGSLGQPVSDGNTVQAAYGSGSGAAGNVYWDSVSALSCWILNC